MTASREVQLSSVTITGPSLAASCRSLIKGGRRKLENLSNCRTCRITACRAIRVQSHPRFNSHLASPHFAQVRRSVIEKTFSQATRYPSSRPFLVESHRSSSGVLKRANSGLGPVPVAPRPNKYRHVIWHILQRRLIFLDRFLPGHDGEPR